MRTFGLVLLLAAAGVTAYTMPGFLKAPKLNLYGAMGALIVFPLVAAARWLLVTGGLLASGAAGGHPGRALGLIVLPAVIEAGCLWMLYVGAMQDGQARPGMQMRLALAGALLPLLPLAGGFLAWWGRRWAFGLVAGVALLAVAGAGVALVVKNSMPVSEELEILRRSTGME